MNERGPFHSILVDHFGLTMAVVIALCVCGALASVGTDPQGGDAKQGSVRSIGDAVGEAETPAPSSTPTDPAGAEA